MGVLDQGKAARADEDARQQETHDGRYLQFIADDYNGDRGRQHYDEFAEEEQAHDVTFLTYGMAPVNPAGAAPGLTSFPSCHIFWEWPRAGDHFPDLFRTSVPPP